MNRSKSHLGLLITVLTFVTLSAMAGPSAAPDAGSTSVLMGFVVAGLVTAKRFLRR